MNKLEEKSAIFYIFKILHTCVRQSTCNEFKRRNKYRSTSCKLVILK